MGFEIKQLEPTATVHVVVAEERLWQTADKESLVPEGHEDAAFLYCVPGQQLLVEEAIRYGLVKGAKKPKQKVEVEPEPEPEPEPQDEGPVSAEEAVQQIDGLETVEEAEVAVDAALAKWPEDEALLAIKARVDEIKSAAAAAAAEEAEPEVDLSSMKLAELREHAAKVGVDADKLKALSKNGTSKKQVIDAINEKLAG